jgi:uncharacterized Zn-binding protein involved in type VI secretion
MARAVIQPGDDASRGGEVISASARMASDDIPAALWGDRCACRIDGHHPCVIGESEPEAPCAGTPVASQGHDFKSMVACDLDIPGVRTVQLLGPPSEPFYHAMVCAVSDRNLGYKEYLTMYDKIMRIFDNFCKNNIIFIYSHELRVRYIAYRYVLGHEFEEDPRWQ